jgi:hypothetical protein
MQIALVEGNAEVRKSMEALGGGFEAEGIEEFRGF